MTTMCERGQASLDPNADDQLAMTVASRRPEEYQLSVVALQSAGYAPSDALTATDICCGNAQRAEGLLRMTSAPKKVRRKLQMHSDHAGSKRPEPEPEPEPEPDGSGGGAASDGAAARVRAAADRKGAQEKSDDSGQQQAPGEQTDAEPPEQNASADSSGAGGSAR